MKARILSGWILGTVLAGGVVASGFARDSLNPSQAAVVAAKLAAATPAHVATTSVEPGTPPQTAPQPSTAAPVTPSKTDDKSLSSVRYLSPWFYEVERLTQAGVDEPVILSYIANSAGTFNLTAEQIISLKKLGASAQVINAMMEHDQELASGARPLTVTAPPPLPPSVQSALAASLHPTAETSAPTTSLVAPLPAPASSIIAPDDEPSGMWIWVEPDDVPEQPASPPVRAPYPVKLNDPIIIFQLPSFNLPCW